MPKKLISLLLASLTTLTGVCAQSWSVVDNWLTLPENQPKLGSMHGDIAVSSDNQIFVAEWNAHGRVHRFNLSK